MAQTPSVGLDGTLEAEEAAPQAQKRAYVSHACQRCRKAKIKCDGDQPCASCAQARAQCTYDQKDKRRRQYRTAQQPIESYEMYRSILERIWQATLLGEEQQLLDLIRSGVSISALAHHMDDHSVRGVGLLPSESASDTNTPGQEENIEFQSASGLNVLRDSTIASQISAAQVEQLLKEAENSAKQSTIPLDRRGWHPALQIPAPPASFLLQGELPQAVTSSERQQRQNSRVGSRAVKWRNNEEAHRAESSRGGGRAGRLVDRTASNHDASHEASPAVGGWHEGPHQVSESPIPPTDVGHIPRLTRDAQMQLLQRPEWQILPNWEFCPSLLGRVYTDFYRACYVRPGSAAPPYQRDDLVDASLYFRERHAGDPHNADTWACELESSFGDEYSHITKLAQVYTLARYMRWLLNPTYENYMRVPHMIRPTLGQRALLHPAPIDLSPIRPIREALLREMRDYVGACSQAGMDVSWPLTVNEALVIAVPDESTAELSTESEQIFISRQFAEHVSNQANWRLGRSILNTFPELEGSDVTIADEYRIEHNDQWL